MAENITNADYIHMDFSLETPEERILKVKEIVANTPSEKLTPTYLEKLSDYIIFADEKQKRKRNKADKNTYSTPNHMKTVNWREISFEGLIGKFENGEDGIYNMITNDKNIIAHPRNPITEEDRKNIPALEDWCKDIEKLEELRKGVRGKKAYSMKQQIIEMRQDQYEIRSAYIKPVRTNNKIKSISQADLTEHITIDKATGLPKSDCIISFFDADQVSELLCNYSKLKEDTWESLNNDMRWMLVDLENLVDKTFKENYPFYYDLIIYKIDGKSNATIQQLLYETYGIRNSEEYLSSLWRNKIPKMIVEQAQKDYLEWHYTYKEKGYWKKCGRCGKIKLGHNLFFSKNKTSKDQLYSICKECRNAKK